MNAPSLPCLAPELLGLLEAVSAALLAHDGQHIVFANDAMLRLLGRTPQELLQLSPEAWAEPAHQPQLLDYGRRCLDSDGALPVLEIDALSVSGTRRQLEITARRLTVAGSAPLVLLTCQDLSDIRHVQNSLLEIGRVMYQIVENGPVASYVIDDAHRVTHWNAACTQLTGRTATEMMGSSERWLAFHTDGRPTLADLIVDGR
ncbi:hypothetical protein DBR42_20320, partial [Pelomonas sp. HMWF004]